MLRVPVTYVPIAALLTVTPGVATALVVRNASRGGRRAAFFTTVGNSIGVLMWGALAAADLAAVVATSARVFTVVKLAGAAVLFVMDARSLLGRCAGSTVPRARCPCRPARGRGTFPRRAKRAFVAGPWARRVERPTGAVLVGLGIRIAIERR